MKIYFKDAITINMQNVCKLFLHGFKKARIHLFFVFLIGFICAGGYIWWKNVYSAEWNDDKKQEYINKQKKEVILNEKDFNNVIDDISLREEEFSREYEPIRDVFEPY